MSPRVGATEARLGGPARKLASLVRPRGGEPSPPSALERDVRPENAQLELNRVERLRAHLGVVAVRREDGPLAILEPELFKRPQNRIDEPHMCHAMFGVDGELFGLVDLRGRG